MAGNAHDVAQSKNIAPSLILLYHTHPSSEIRE